MEIVRIICDNTKCEKVIFEGEIIYKHLYVDNASCSLIIKRKKLYFCDVFCVTDYLLKRLGHNPPKGLW